MRAEQMEIENSMLCNTRRNLSYREYARTHSTVLETLLSTTSHHAIVIIREVGELSFVAIPQSA